MIPSSKALSPEGSHPPRLDRTRANRKRPICAAELFEDHHPSRVDASTWEGLFGLLLEVEVNELHEGCCDLFRPKYARVCVIAVVFLVGLGRGVAVNMLFVFAYTQVFWRHIGITVKEFFTPCKNSSMHTKSHHIYIVNVLNLTYRTK